MATFTVTNLNDNGLGSLRQAILDANSLNGADLITFDPTLNGQTITLTSSELLITDDVTIDGDINDDDNPDITIERNAGAANFRIIKVDDGDDASDKTIQLEGLTITGGNLVIENGSGISNKENLTLLNSTVRNNTITGYKGSGSGMYHSTGTLTVSSSTISGNSRDGIYSRNGKVLSVENSTITNNAGTGLYNRYGELIVDASTITNNANEVNSNVFGGGISAIDADLTITNSTISGNSSATGGGILSNGLTNRIDLTITNSTISNNKASNVGGGVYVQNANVAITNATLSGNEASQKGGGLFVDQFESSGNVDDSVSIANSTISNNTAESAGGIFRALGATPFTLANSIVADNIGGDVRSDRPLTPIGINIVEDGSISGALTLDPLLGPLQNNGGITETQALLVGSPAIDRGTNGLIPADIADVDNDTNTTEPVPFDQRGNGFARIANGSVDLGAVEFPGSGATSISLPGQFPTLTVDTLVDENDFDLSAGDISLREAIAFIENGGTITFAPSLAGGQIALASALMIDKSLTIQGLGAESITLDANGNDRLFIINDGDDDRDQTVILESMTLTGGLTQASNTTGDRIDAGGAILNHETLTVRNSRLTNNSSAGGGGSIFNNGGTVEVLSSTISGNSSDAIGGGIFNHSGTMAVRDSVINDNASINGGGGIASNDGTLTVSNSTLTKNSAIDEIYQYANGGGIFSIGNLTISNSTIHNNSSNYGGGISNAGTTTLESTIVAGNAAGFGGTSDIFNNSGTISARLSLIEDGTITDDLGNNIIGQDPLLDPAGLQDNGGATHTIALQPGSPAINTGSNPDGLVSDQRGDGFSRVFGGRADIGAFEVQPTPPPSASQSFYFSADRDKTIGNLNVDDEDIVFFDGNDVSIFFDGSNVLPRKAKINAFDIVDDTTILMSFSRAINIKGVGRVDDSDVVKFTASSLGKGTTQGRFKLHLDGSDLGLTERREDIDALTQMPDGSLLFSTRSNATLSNGLRSKGEDLLRFEPISLRRKTSGTVSRYMDGSDVNLTRRRENIDAVSMQDDQLILSTRGNFRVPGLSGQNEDAFRFSPTSLGRATSGSFDELLFDGSQAGFTGNLSGFDIGIG
ncbi:MAG: right-handed parallel beta-helix repeat-containing protein [Cyanobacteria bacterium P01_A01_bin.37]